MRITRCKIVVGVALLVGLTVLAPMASAYYYWIFFSSASGPFTSVPGHYDLSALKDNTVQYFISDAGPSTLLPGDSQTALYSQIQQAAAQWNQVGSSALRLRFGGIETVGAVPQTTPGIDVVFDDDMPPGILAQTMPTFPADLSILAPQGKTPAATFVPLLRARVQLRSNLTTYLQASFSDAYFLTLVHEFGHAVGLQHTLTSGVMSTAITRGTLKGTPLAADDVAAVSLLYPTPGYVSGTGSIAGQITITASGNTTGVNLASVVALAANGVVVSALTNPDGTYEIDGLPPGSYYVYAHPLPGALTGEVTPANIIPPVDPQGDDFSANTSFGTLFYPATRDWTKAKQVTVTAANISGGINVSVPARPGGPALGSMQVYGYQNGVAVAAPPLPQKSSDVLVFTANGATVNQNTQETPGLAVSVIGSAASVQAGTLKYYTEGFLQMTVNTAAATAPTPVALAVTANSDLYVLPAGFTVEPSAPPAINTLTQTTTAQGVQLATVVGAKLTAQTQILVDGALAPLQSVQADGSLVVSPPPGPSGYTGMVEAVNPDGQTSLQALAITANGPAAAPTYVYAQQNAPSMTSWPGAVTAGTDTWLEVLGTNTNFIDGQTVVGFGSSEITVRRIWVAGPGLALLDVSISAGAQPGTYNWWASTGLQLVQASGALTITAPPAPGQPTVLVPVVNAATGLAGVPAGGTALISTKGLGKNVDSSHGWSVALDNISMPFSTDANGVISAQVPRNAPVGPHLVQVSSASGVAPSPVYMQLDSPPPTIVGIATIASDGSFHGISATTPAHPGDTLAVWMVSLADVNGVYPPQSSVYVNLGAVSSAASTNDATHVGINYPVAALFQASKDTPGLWVTEFSLPSDFTLDPTQPAQLPVMVGTGTRLAQPFLINFAPVPAAQ